MCLFDAAQHRVFRFKCSIQAMSIYEKLGDWLTKNANSHHTLTFAEIESILGRRLPDSAHRYPAFWSRGNNVGNVLVTTGWRAHPKLSEQAVEFTNSDDPQFLKFEPTGTRKSPEQLNRPNMQGSQLVLTQKTFRDPHLSRENDLKRFYLLLGELKSRSRGYRYLSDCHGRMDWPTRGIYFFFERTELRSDTGDGERVVRVGTHALKETSKTTLWKRLSQHRGSGDTGGGNHRGSIFRLIVGVALKTRKSDLDVPSWGVGGSAPAAVKDNERGLEQAVSEVIRRMPFLSLAIDDAPGRDSLRGYIERNSIALLSNFRRNEVDPASADWLGRSCNREKVRESGLWNSNHVDEQYDPRFLDVLEKLIKHPGRTEAFPAPTTDDGKFDIQTKPARKAQRTSAVMSPRSDDLRRTLLLIPCSGRKNSSRRFEAEGPRVIDGLPEKLAAELAAARRENSQRSRLDETSLVQAWQRYNGTLYQAASRSLRSAVEKGLHVLIVSGGYGLVLMEEPIGIYEAVFKTSWWPRGLLEDVLIAYCAQNNLTSVRAFMARSTGYGKLVHQVPWKKAGIDDALLLAPQATTGAMVKTPRALGEAFAAFLSGELDENWASSDGLRLDACILE